MVQVTVLDYGAGNVRSVKNAITAAGHTFKDVQSADDIRHADVLIFPGVGNFQKAMEFLNAQGYTDVLREYIQQDKRFLGICLGMQTLFEGSEECPGLKVTSRSSVLVYVCVYGTHIAMVQFPHLCHALYCNHIYLYSLICGWIIMSLHYNINAGPGRD